MSLSYFILEDDLNIVDRWYLDGLYDNSGIRFDEREFRYGSSVDVGPPMRLRLWNEDKIIEAKGALQVLLDPKRKGIPLDFTYTNSEMPVVTEKVGNILIALDINAIQRIPIHVDSRVNSYDIINIISCIDCLDIARSEIQWFKKNNTIRPDLAGLPEMITKLIIDTNRVKERHIFRVKGWTLPVIVSEAVKEAFEIHKVSGITFRKAS